MGKHVFNILRNISGFQQNQKRASYLQREEVNLLKERVLSIENKLKFFKQDFSNNEAKSNAVAPSSILAGNAFAITWMTGSCVFNVSPRSLCRRPFRKSKY